MAIFEMIFYTLVVLGVLVTFHEFGHFWVARRCGIKVVRFSIGFGPALVRWRDRHDTEFVIAALPLGGYVKMIDEREGEVAEADLPYAFNRKSVAQRMATVVAGPLANFVLAILAYWIIFMLGVQGIAPIIDEVKSGSIADAAGLESGQEIIAVDGESTATWQDLGERLVHRIGEHGTIRFSARYPDSDLQYDSEAALRGWDIDAREPDPIGSIGITLYRPKILPVADKLTSGDPADMAGMRTNDLVLSVDGNEMPDWATWVEYVRARPGQTLLVLIERDGEAIPLSVMPKPVTTADNEIIGQVGMSVVMPEWPEDLYRESKYGILGALGKAWSQTGKTTLLILGSVKKMITGDISLEHLSGPITIAKVAGASASYGLVAFLQFMALLSVSLGVLNLLPIPVLDGGHLVYYLAELVKGSPVSMKVQEMGYRLGLFLVVGLMVLALYNDLARL
jgi:regulator of sigma E protease